MGILDLFRKKPEIKIETSFNPSMPTVKADIALFTAYSEIFRKEMATIPAFSHAEIEAMHDYISNGEGGYLNQAHYHSTIFEQFFKNREWVWPEWEKWKEISFRLGVWPTSIGRMKFRCKFEELFMEEKLGMLKALELKELLKNMGVAFSSKDTKKDLLASALKLPSLTTALPELPAWTRISNEYTSSRNFALYSLLMMLISGRASCLRDVKRGSELGIEKRNIRLAHGDDQKFVDIALAENPNSLTPFFPGDDSYWQSVIPGID